MVLTYGATISPTARPSSLTWIPATPAAAPRCTALCMLAGSPRKVRRSLPVMLSPVSVPPAGVFHQLAGMSIQFAGLKSLSVSALLYSSISRSSHPSSRSRVASFPSKAACSASQAESNPSMSPPRQASHRASAAACCAAVASIRAVRTGLLGPLPPTFTVGAPARASMASSTVSPLVLYLSALGVFPVKMYSSTARPASRCISPVGFSPDSSTTLFTSSACCCAFSRLSRPLISSSRIG